MTDHEAKELLIKYRKGKCSPEEIDLVDKWYTRISESSKESFDDAKIALAKENVWQRIERTARNRRRRRIVAIGVTAAAAAILLFMFLPGKHFFNNHRDNNLVVALLDTLPGGNKAILQLENGRKIDLDRDIDNMLSTNTGLQITQPDSSKIVYQQTDYRPGSAGTNTLITPDDGQFQVVLSDGTKAYLNAGSSLTYPVSFADDERRVEYTGEVHFEVAANEKHPFIAFNTDQTVKVLGTSFNVNAYKKDSIRTTLVEGKVNVIKNATLESQVLIPNTQSLLTANGIVRRDVNALSAIMWIKGFFVFKDTPLKEALFKISKWYHVEVDYNSLPETLLDGNLYRHVPFHIMINSLNTMGNVRLRFKDGRITAM